MPRSPLRAFTLPLITWLFALASCSFVNPKPVTSLKIPTQIKERSASTVKWEFALLERNPYLYKRTDSSAGYNTFLTILAACGEAQAKSSSTATRQLLVGFKDPQIIAQTTLTTGEHNLLRSFTKASLDGTPLLLVTYTLKNKSCFRDYVLWFGENQDQTLDLSTVQAELPGFEAYLADLIREG